MTQHTVHSQYNLYLQDGVVLVKRALSRDALKAAEELFDYRITHPTPRATQPFKSSAATFVADTGDIASWSTPEFQRVVFCTEISELARSFLSSNEMWFYYETVFLKEGNGVGAEPTHWHQDSTYIPGDGDDFARPPFQTADAGL
jgi:hypothetical protein